MRLHEFFSLNEQSLSDVGVRADRFYLSARGDSIDWDEFLATGKLRGVRGVSSSRDIWKNFSPNAGRDILFIMPAKSLLRMNKVRRVKYDSAEDLVANNSKKIGRILSIKDVSTDIGDNLIVGCFPRTLDIIDGDRVTVTNAAMGIAFHLRKKEKPSTRYPAVDDSVFDWQNGLQLNSIDDYATLYHQAAKAAGWYGKEYVKFFAPQNRRRWYPAISEAIVRQANVYADEAEWIVDSPEFTVPPDTHVILAIPQKYQDGPPPEDDRVNSWFWSRFDDERHADYQKLLKMFAKSRFKFSVVEAGKASNSLLSAQTRQRARTDK